MDEVSFNGKTFTYDNSCLHPPFTFSLNSNLDKIIAYRGSN